MRGGAENITLNVLVRKPYETILIQFLEILSPLIHDIHIIMDKTPDSKDEIQSRIEKIRNILTSIILAYEELYGIINDEK
jgi:hypothetical protein